MEKPDRDVDINRAYIPVVNEKVSKGAIRDYYNTVQNSDGKVDNVMAVPVSYTHLTLPTKRIV